jgi:hypothetical protein
MTNVRRFLLAALTATLLLALGAVSAQGMAVQATRACPPKTIHNKLAAIATVLSAKSMSCARARTIVRRNGKKASRDDNAFVKSGRFMLGRFTCRVYYKVEEDNKARCKRGDRSFRVDYGS